MSRGLAVTVLMELNSENWPDNVECILSGLGVCFLCEICNGECHSHLCRIKGKCLGTSISN